MDFNVPYPGQCGTVALFCRLGNVQSLSEALLNGASVDIKDNRGWYATHEAAFSNHSNCLKLLFQHANDKIDVNWQSFDGSTALLIACQQSHFESAQVLLNNGADQNLGSLDQMRPIIAAAKSPALVKLLFEKGADPTLPYWNRWTALHEACYIGSEEVVSMLLETEIDLFSQDTDGLTPLFVTAQYNRLSIMNMLLEKAGENARRLTNTCTKDGASCIYMAAQEGYDRCLKLLLHYGANPNLCTHEGIHPIVAATKHNYTRSLNVLLPKTDISIVSHSVEDPIYVAIEENHMESVEILLQAGFPVNRRTQYSCVNAIYNYLSPLLDRPTLSPLGMAVSRMNIECMEMLLNLGAPPTIGVKQCHSPLLFAIIKRQEPQVLKTLLEYNVNLNFVSTNSYFQVPDAVLMAAHPIYREQFILMLQCGLRPCLENWCSCKNPNREPLLTEIRRVLTENEMKDLLTLLIDHSYSVPDCCQQWRNMTSTIGISGKIPSLLHLSRFVIRNQLGSKALYDKSWLGFPFLPKELTDFLLYL